MPSLLRAALGSILRHLLTGGAAYLVARGVWTETEAAEYVSAVALALLGLLWSLWQKYRTKLTILAALETPAGTSLEKFTTQQRL